jgi:hypothetical protein
MNISFESFLFWVLLVAWNSISTPCMLISFEGVGSFAVREIFSAFSRRGIINNWKNFDWHNKGL